MGESIIRTILIALKYLVDRASENQANESVQAFVNRAMRSLRALGSVAATISFDRIVQNLLDATSTAESVQFRFDNIYGELSQSQQEWAEEFADTYNRSATIVKHSLADIQQALIGFAPGGDRNVFAQMSRDIEELGLNLGAFYGMDSQTAVNTLLSAVQGSTGAMQQFGITDFAKYRHQAMADVGITDRSYALLTNQEKAMVNYQIVLNANKGALDALSRSQDTYATKLQNFHESLEELREVLGEFFLPTAKRILDIIISVVRAITTVIDAVKEVTDALGITDAVITALTIGIIALVGVDVVRWGMGIIQTLVRMATQAGTTGAAMLGLSRAALGAIAGVTGVILVLVDLTNYLNGKDSQIGGIFDKFNIGAETGIKIAKALREGIIAMTVAYIAFRIAVLAGNAALAATPIGWVAAGIGLVIGLITLLANNTEALTEGFSNAIDGIGTAIHSVGEWFSSIFEKIGNAFHSIWDWIQQHADIFMVFLGPVGWLILIIKHLDKVKELARQVGDFFRRLLGIQPKNQEPEQPDNPPNPSGINPKLSYIDGVASGQDMVNGMADGIISAMPNLEKAAADAAQVIADYDHFSVPEKGPLSDFDKSMPDMMNMMASGIQSNRGKVLTAAANVAGGIRDLFRMAWQNVEPTFGGFLGFGTISNGETEHVSLTSHFMDWMVQNNSLLGQAVDYLALLAGTNSTTQMANGLISSKVITLNPTFTFTQTFNADTAGPAEMQTAAEESGEDITSSLARYLRLIR